MTQVCGISVFIFCLFQAGIASKILFFYAGGAYSHEISVGPLVKQLSRNHNITFLSAHKKKPFDLPSVKVIAPQNLIDFIAEEYLDEKISARLNHQESKVWYDIIFWSAKVCDILLNSDDIQMKNFFAQNEFDLVIIDAVMCDCGFIVSYHFNAKTILIDSTTVLPWYYDIYSLPKESSWVPQMSRNYKYPMGFFDRLINYFDTFYWTAKRRLQMYPELEKTMRKFIGSNDYPTFLELERNVSLVLLNTHYSTDFSRALPPHFIQIGGLQCFEEDNVPIPKDIEAFINKAEKIVLVAFGSSIDSNRMPKKILKIFLDSMRKLENISFIWKWSGAIPENSPKNIFYTEWLPQKEVLGHKKTAGFITHCGLNSVMEATYHGVPLVAFPLFADQDNQAYRIESEELGIRVDAKDMTENILTGSVNEIITNKLYRNNMAKFSQAFRDRPMKPKDTALYWINYVLTHDDLSPLKPKIDHLSFFQFYLFDTVVFIFSLLFLFIFTVLLIIKSLIYRAESKIRVAKKTKERRKKYK